MLPPLLAAFILGGCGYAIGIPLPEENRIEEPLRHYKRWPSHKAFAVAGDIEGKFTYGYSMGKASEGEARLDALKDCHSRAADKRIPDNCWVMVAE